jgi:hypothetical protein
MAISSTGSKIRGIRVINARLNCPVCDTPHVLNDLQSGPELTCSCGTHLAGSPAAMESGRITKCPICGTPELYIQKDFPERVGMAIVGLGVILASIAWANYSWIGTFGILFAFGVVDWIFFYTRKNVTVCYRCLAQYRGMETNPDHHGFDLAIGEKYRQERLRKAELKAK